MKLILRVRLFQSVILYRLDCTYKDRLVIPFSNQAVVIFADRDIRINNADNAD